MKLLLLDIETAPNTAYVWGLFNENIPLQRLVESSYVMCWAAKWYGEKEVMFDSVQKSSPKQMLKRIHRLLSEADAVIHYNGTRFDIPILNKEFLFHKMQPPAPYKQIDLIKVARNRFKFVSNKLDYVAKALGIRPKHKHRGFELWIDCMRKDPAAWKEMEIYNKGDVLTLEEMYERLLPWIRNHPNRGLYIDGNPLVCPSCGGVHFHRRGYAYTSAVRYVRYQCQDCGTWFRGNSTKNPTKKFIGVH